MRKKGEEIKYNRQIRNSSINNKNKKMKILGQQTGRQTKTKF